MQLMVIFFIRKIQCYYRELEQNKNKNDFNIVFPNEN